MKTAIFCTVAIPSNSATRYSTCHDLGSGQAGWTASEPQGSILNVAGTIASLYVDLGGTAPGSGKSWTVTVRVNGVDSALAVTISNAATTGSATASISIAAGDRVTLKCVPSGTPSAPSTFETAMEFSGTASGVSPWCGSQTAGLDSGRNGPCQGSGDPSTSGIGIMPTGGTISYLRARSPSALASGESIVLALNVNGSDSTLTVTLDNTHQEAEDPTHTVTVAAGDKVYISIIHYAGSGSGAIVSAYGVKWTPTTEGEAVVMGRDQLNSFGQRYVVMQSIASDAAAETLRCVLPFAADWKKLYLDGIGEAPGGAATFTVTGRQNAADSALTVTLTGAAQTGNDITHTVTLSAGDRLTIGTLGGGGAGGPTFPAFGAVLFVAAAGGGTTRGMPFGTRSTAFNGGRALTGVLR